MGEMRLNSLQSLHTRPLQSFKIIEDPTITLHRDVRRQYQYYSVMYGDLAPAYPSQVMRLCDQDMNNLIREYENRVPYHACGEGEIKFWAGTGERIKQAVLWNECEKAGSQTKTPRALYKRIVIQLHDEILCREENSVESLTPSGARLNSMPSPRLAEELGATVLDEHDRELVESWEGGVRCTNPDKAGVDYNVALEEKNSGSSTETFEEDIDFTTRSELDDQHDDDFNDPKAGLLFVRGVDTWSMAVVTRV